MGGGGVGGLPSLMLQRKRQGLRMVWRTLLGPGATEMWCHQQREEVCAWSQTCGFWLLASVPEETESQKLGQGLASLLWAPG